VKWGEGEGEEEGEGKRDRGVECNGERGEKIGWGDWGDDGGR